MKRRTIQTFRNLFIARVYLSCGWLLAILAGWVHTRWWVALIPIVIGHVLTVTASLIAAAIGILTIIGFSVMHFFNSIANAFTILDGTSYSIDEDLPVNIASTTELPKP